MNFISEFLSIKKSFFLNKKLVYAVSLLTITLFFGYIFLISGNHTAKIVLKYSSKSIPSKNLSFENKNLYINFRLFLNRVELLTGEKFKLWNSVHDQDIFFFAAIKKLEEGIFYINFKREYDVIGQELTYTATINAGDKENLEIEKRKFYSSLKNLNSIISNKYINYVEDLMLPIIDLEILNYNLNKNNIELFPRESFEKEKLIYENNNKIINLKQQKKDTLSIMEIMKSDGINFIAAKEIQPKNNLKIQHIAIATLLIFILWIILILIGNFSIAEYRKHMINK